MGAVSLFMLNYKNVSSNFDENSKYSS